MKDKIIMGNLISNLDPQLVQKEKENKEYIDDHILHVNIAFNDYFLILLENQVTNSDDQFMYEFKNAIYDCAELISVHDLSKYSNEEFDAYRLNFYPTTEEKNSPDYSDRIKEIFDPAWVHHYTNNPHHPQYWLDDNKNPIDMELKYIIEMICDWIAMSNKFGGTVIDWYNNSAGDEKSYMTENTKRIVEKIFTIIF